MSAKDELIKRQKAPLTTPSDIDPSVVTDITEALNVLLADVFSLYLKTKNFHWHMSGPHFRDYHLLLDDHGDQIFAMTDDIADFQLPTTCVPRMKPSWMSVSRLMPRHMTVFPGGGSLARAR